MRVRRILVPVDFSRGSLAAVRHAQQIALLTDAKVHLLHVTDSARSVVSRTDLNDLDDFRCDGRLRAYHKLAEVIACNRLDPFHTTGIIRRGVPDKVIVGYADEIHADLIVMGIHGEDQTPPHSPGRVIERVWERLDVQYLQCPIAGDACGRNNRAQVTLRLSVSRSIVAWPVAWDTPNLLADEPSSMSRAAHP